MGALASFEMLKCLTNLLGCIYRIFKLKTAYGKEMSIDQLGADQGGEVSTRNHPMSPHENIV